MCRWHLLDRVHKPKSWVCSCSHWSHGTTSMSSVSAELDPLFANCGASKNFNVIKWLEFKFLLSYIPADNVQCIFFFSIKAIDSIHQVGVYCLALVPANTLPKAPLGGIHISETKQRFLEGALHPCNVLMCPHTCVSNLPKPRQKQPGE